MADRREEIEKAIKFKEDAEKAEADSKKRIGKRENAARSHLLDKAGVMGAKLRFYPKKEEGTYEEADKAFDAVQNYDESRAEDERTKVKMLAAKIRSMREKSK